MRYKGVLNQWDAYTEGQNPPKNHQVGTFCPTSKNAIELNLSGINFFSFNWGCVRIKKQQPNTPFKQSFYGGITNKSYPQNIMKILCILYDDPKSGMPQRYALDSIPKLEKYPDGMTLPSPKAIDFTPGELLGCVSGELGLRKFLEDNGHTLVVTSDKDGEGCQADKELVDADVISHNPSFPFI